MQTKQNKTLLNDSLALGNASNNNVNIPILNSRIFHVKFTCHILSGRLIYNRVIHMN